MQPIAPPLWRQILRQNFTDITLLADFLELNQDQRQNLLARSRFALNLPKRLAYKIAKGTLEDPILKQFLPTANENAAASNFLSDPVGDGLCKKTKKLLHKYQGRVLLLCTSACAMHCRYCFRQHFEYDATNKIFEEELRMIAEDSSISEVILSGGDPLSLDNRILEDLLSRLSLLSHVRSVRFHTRFPMGIPERLDSGFLSLFGKFPFQFWFIIHSNHPNEFDEDIFKALKRVRQLGIPILNQSVLLKGVNDQFSVLFELCSKLVDNGIIPYYLHQLDRVQGAAHFEVSEVEGKELIRRLSDSLPGYAVPRYVKEIPGMPGKTPIFFTTEKRQ